ncbi:MAG: hypothetical protein B6241_06565 [Spirochaetaceae bacterium 4572_59]|nr:MAG: hypothetical protein B6241_06565 [Spirochaetaceae bacterium 4572_59]
MKDRNIYFLHWNTNKCFISDLPEKSELIEYFENGAIKGQYGSSPDTEDLQSFQSEWKVKIDLAVRSWFNDSKFLLHFILATAIFLLSFYFLSYVIRDPLPLVDEIVLSLVLSILAWFRLSNQEVHSEKALVKKQELTQSLNSISFENGAFLKQVELYLEKVSSMERNEVLEMMKEGATPLFFNTYSQEMIDFRKALGNHLKKSRFSVGRLFRKKGTVLLETYPELQILFDQLTVFLKNS